LIRRISATTVIVQGPSTNRLRLEDSRRINGASGRMRAHAGLGRFLESVTPPRLLAFSTRAERLYDAMDYRENDALLFGPETRGLPQKILNGIPDKRRLRLPLVPGNRSLNLSIAVAVVVYEAWRQRGFNGGK
jgi:tRNA (cytidine/uridine-2'-O-)-methyltransferase